MFFHGLELLGPKKYEIDLSNELLNFNFGQGAVKISKVKVGGQKEIADSAGFETDAPGTGRVGRYFFGPPTLTSNIFAAP